MLQPPSVPTVLALVALGAHVASLAQLLHGREQRGPVVSSFVELVARGQARAAVARARSLERRLPVRRVALALMALELPEVGGANPGATGYRDAPEREPFADIVRRVADGEVARARSALRPGALGAFATGVLAASTGVGALVFGADGWVGATMSIGTTGIVGTGIAIVSTRTWLSAARSCAEQLVPLLRPAEQMDDEHREAARSARDALEEPETGLSSLALTLIPFVAIAIAIGIAAIGR